MKKAIVSILLLVVAFAADARRKPVAILAEDEFNPWFGEPVQKLGPVDNSRSTVPLPSKMDKIEPDSTEYKETKQVFSQTRPEGHAYPTKKVIRKVLHIPEKMEKISNEFDLKR